MRKIKVVLKSIALVLVAAFVVQELAWAAPLLSSSPSLGGDPVDSRLRVNDIVMDPSRLEMPSEFSSLKEFHRGSNGKLIIHIQDAHSNLSGQENLAKTLEAIGQKYFSSPLLVFSEGGEGDCSLTSYKNTAAPEVWKRVARSHLVQGNIAGEEYLNLTSDLPMQIIGVEDSDLYLQSLKDYAALAGKREAILNYLAQIRLGIEKLKNRYYPKELLEYEKESRQKTVVGSQVKENVILEKLLDLTEKTHIDLSKFPNVQKLAALKQKEKLIDFNLANLEHAALLEELNVIASPPKAGAAISDTSRFTLFQNTFNNARKKGISLEKYPHLLRYQEYLTQFQSVELDKTLDEMEKVEEKLYLKLLTGVRPLLITLGYPQGSDPSEEARLIRAIDRYVRLLETAYRIQMSTQEFGLFKVNEHDFATISYLAFLNRKLAEEGYFEDMIPYEELLEDGKKSLEAFYGSVAQRDYAFVRNIDKIMENGEWKMESGEQKSKPSILHSPLSIVQPPKAAVLIAGGYHTPHLKKLLRERGYSYVILTPHVTSETNQKKYEKILLAPVQKETKTVQTASDGARPHKNSDGLRAALVASRLGNGRLSDLLNDANPSGARVAKDDPILSRLREYESYHDWRVSPNIHLDQEPHAQGWKFHVILTEENAVQVLNVMLPVLNKMNIGHKVIGGLSALGKLRGTQRGKGITIYFMETDGRRLSPGRTYEEAAADFGNTLERALALKGLRNNSNVQWSSDGKNGDKRFGGLESTGLVGYRFGSFVDEKIWLEDGNEIEDNRRIYKPEHPDFYGATLSDPESPDADAELGRMADSLIIELKKNQIDQSDWEHYRRIIEEGHTVSEKFTPQSYFTIAGIMTSNRVPLTNPVFLDLVSQKFTARAVEETGGRPETEGARMASEKGSPFESQFTDLGEYQFGYPVVGLPQRISIPLKAFEGGLVKMSLVLKRHFLQPFVRVQVSYSEGKNLIEIYFLDNKEVIKLRSGESHETDYGFLFTLSQDKTLILDNKGAGKVFLMRDSMRELARGGSSAVEEKHQQLGRERSDRYYQERAERELAETESAGRAQAAAHFREVFNDTISRQLSIFYERKEASLSEFFKAIQEDRLLQVPTGDPKDPRSAALRTIAQTAIEVAKGAAQAHIDARARNIDLRIYPQSSGDDEQKQQRLLEELLRVIREVPEGLLRKAEKPILMEFKILSDHVLGQADLWDRGGIALNVRRGRSTATVVAHELLHKLSTMKAKGSEDMTLPVADWIRFLRANGYVSYRDAHGVAHDPEAIFSIKKEGLDAVIRKIRNMDGVNFSHLTLPIEESFTHPDLIQYFRDPHECLAHTGSGEGKKYQSHVEGLKILEENFLNVGGVPYRFSNGRWAAVVHKLSDSDGARLTTETGGRPKAEGGRLANASAGGGGLVFKVKPIEESVTTILKRAQIRNLVEKPLVKAAEIFYDLNIETRSSSANRKNFDVSGDGRAFIALDYGSLSHENRLVFESLSSKFPGVQTSILEGEKNSANIYFLIHASTTVNELSDKAVAVANEFKWQPMTWAQAYTLDDMRKRLFFRSQEHAEKTNQVAPARMAGWSEVLGMMGAFYGIGFLMMIAINVVVMSLKPDSNETEPWARSVKNVIRYVVGTLGLHATYWMAKLPVMPMDDNANLLVTGQILRWGYSIAFGMFSALFFGALYESIRSDTRLSKSSQFTWIASIFITIVMTIQELFAILKGFTMTWYAHEFSHGSNSWSWKEGRMDMPDWVYTFLSSIAPVNAFLGAFESVINAIADFARWKVFEPLFGHDYGDAASAAYPGYMDLFWALTAIKFAAWFQQRYPSVSNEELSTVDWKVKVKAIVREWVPKVLYVTASGYFIFHSLYFLTDWLKLETFGLEGVNGDYGYLKIVWENLPQGKIVSGVFALNAAFLLHQGVLTAVRAGQVISLWIRGRAVPWTSFLKHALLTAGALVLSYSLVYISAPHELGRLASVSSSEAAIRLQNHSLSRVSDSFLEQLLLKREQLLRKRDLDSIVRPTSDERSHFAEREYRVLFRRLGPDAAKNALDEAMNEYKNRKKLLTHIRTHLANIMDVDLRILSSAYWMQWERYSDAGTTTFLAFRAINPTELTREEKIQLGIFRRQIVEHLKRLGITNTEKILSRITGSGARMAIETGGRLTAEGGSGARMATSNPAAETIRKGKVAFEYRDPNEQFQGVDLEHFVHAQNRLAEKLLSETQLNKTLQYLEISRSGSVERDYAAIYEALANGRYDKEVIDLINADTYEDPRLAIEIVGQNKNPRAQSIYEAVSNSLDALGLNIGQFGKGVKQIVDWLGATGKDRIDVFTSKNGTSYQLTILRDVQGQLYIEIKQISSKELERIAGKTLLHGTVVRVTTESAIPRTDNQRDDDRRNSQEGVAEGIHRRFQYVTRVRITTQTAENAIPREVNGFKNKREIVSPSIPEAKDRDEGEQVEVILEDHTLMIVDNGAGMDAKTLSRMFVPKQGSKHPEFLSGAASQSELARVKVVQDESLPHRVSFARNGEVIMAVDIPAEISGSATVAGGLLLEFGSLLDTGESRDQISIPERLKPGEISNFQLALQHMILRIADNPDLSDAEKVKTINMVIVGLDGLSEGNESYAHAIKKIKIFARETLSATISALRNEGYVILPQNRQFEKILIPQGKKGVLFVNENLFDWQGVVSLMEIGAVKIPGLTLGGEKRLPLLVFPFKKDSVDKVSGYHPEWHLWEEGERYPMVKTDRFILVSEEIGKRLYELALKKSSGLTPEEEREFSILAQEINILTAEVITTSYEFGETRANISLSEIAAVGEGKVTVDSKAVQEFLTVPPGKKEKAIYLLLTKAEAGNESALLGLGPAVPSITDPVKKERAIDLLLT
ncbi:MAG: hypothetical protein HY592_00845, partial [Candidatus Omnitrophica bacterium]|nr:hypothetical protein [Candidatus Omnitrophota bacterium]